MKPWMDDLLDGVAQMLEHELFPRSATVPTSSAPSGRFSRCSTGS